METQTAVKQVRIDDVFYRYLPLQKITAGSSSKQGMISHSGPARNGLDDTSTYQVGRVRAVIKVNLDSSRDPTTIPPNSAATDALTFSNPAKAINQVSN